MQRPDDRSAIMDNPIQPSIPRSLGITSSRTCAMPASIDSGLAMIVVERAYTIHTPLALWQRPSGATGRFPHSSARPTRARDRWLTVPMGIPDAELGQSRAARWWVRRRRIGSIERAAAFVDDVGF